MVMIKFDYATASVCGHRHNLKNIPNQDAVKVVKSEYGTVVAIADGHGGSPCFRSEIGAKIAVDVACDVLQKNIKKYNEFNALQFDDECGVLEKSDSKAAPKIEYKRFAKCSLMDIDKSWTKEVMKHMEKSKFKDEELNQYPEDKQKMLERNPFLAYGTTIMATLIADDTVIFVNIGDGSFLLKELGKDTIEFKSGSSVFGNETESLAMPEAYKEGKVMVYPSGRLDSFLISTDGYVNSFKNTDGFSKVLMDLKNLRDEHGINEIKNNWSDWLSETSKDGSGDDITACCVFF